MPSIRTLAGRFAHEIPKIRGSRFLATVAPVASAEAALAEVAELRARWRDATHHCWAYRLLGDDEHRASDDGEPSGSAGRPILAEIQGRDLRAVVAVVTRWYGGTKLGTGGLVRAYGGAAAAAFDLAPIVVRPVTRRLTVSHGYERTGEVQAVLAVFALAPLAARYAERVRFDLEVPVEEVERLRQALVDATAGRVELGA